ncbi:uncharacterized protein LOC115986454 [Quercus lobata]|uniref:uncharacterized protein LOC115986454 n=1 Tax=Quercus lobata TaxID=97700 RepID=UPI001245E8D3|nr:uncharacterized protein LOC115986454 [Quercus lobata]
MFCNYNKPLIKVYHPQVMLYLHWQRRRTTYPLETQSLPYCGSITLMGKHSFITKHYINLTSHQNWLKVIEKEIGALQLEVLDEIGVASQLSAAPKGRIALKRVDAVGRLRI